MSAGSLPHSGPHTGAELTWAIAELYPYQGYWDEAEYLELTDWSNRLIEYTNGHVEFLPVPTLLHQMIQGLIYRRLFDFVDTRKLGFVTTAGTRVYAGSKKYRQPDVVYRSFKNYDSSQSRYLNGAELVVEVVSEDEGSRERDYEQKVADYAAAKITEYWIVDPQLEVIKVLALESDAYVEHSVGRPGDTVASKLLDGFTLDVKATFDEGKLPDTM